MSVISKFLKKVTLIKDKDTWTAKEWIQVFLAKLDLVNWSNPVELITNCNPNFLSKFWAAQFKKLEVKLFYSTAYHPQIDRSSQRTNQTVEIALQFFIYAFNNPRLWPQVLSQIQAIINNNSSSSTRKTSNKVPYSFFLCRPLDLLAALSTPDVLVACADATKAVSFALFNQKVTYKWKHKPLFMKIGE